MSNNADHYKGWSIAVSAIPQKSDPNLLHATVTFAVAIYLTRDADGVFESHQLTMGETFTHVRECLAAGHEYARKCIDCYEA
jgi:hypothetical protein